MGEEVDDRFCHAVSLKLQASTALLPEELCKKYNLLVLVSHLLNTVQPVINQEVVYLPKRMLKLLLRLQLQHTVDQRSHASIGIEFAAFR